MNINKIGVRYAKALVAFSIEQNIEDKVFTDIELINEIITESHEIDTFLKNPTIKISEKIIFFEKIFKDHIHKITLKFLILVIRKGRELFFKDIFRNIIDRYHKIKKIKKASLITANTITPKTKEDITTLIKKYFSDNYTIIFHHQIDKKQIGGFLLTIGNEEFDITIKSQLNHIKQNLINTNFQVKL
ncbi:MAG TPA: ATP synthase F1 subunit delta [Bacteroidales bacterium]|nr:ATP synthase F1 subunit delta [Bacteroidales bacterium]